MLVEMTEHRKRFWTKVAQMEVKLRNGETVSSKEQTSAAYKIALERVQQSLSKSRASPNQIKLVCIS